MNATVEALDLRTYKAKFDNTKCTLCRGAVNKGEQITLIPKRIRSVLNLLGMSLKVYKYSHVSCLPALLPEDYTPEIRKAAEYLLILTDPKWPKDNMGFNSGDAPFAQKWLGLDCPQIGSHYMAQRLVKYLDTQLDGKDSEQGQRILDAAAWAPVSRRAANSNGSRLPKGKASRAPSQAPERCDLFPRGIISDKVSQGGVKIVALVGSDLLRVTLLPYWENEEHGRIKDAIKIGGASWGSRKDPSWYISPAGLAHALDAFASVKVSIDKDGAAAITKAMGRRELSGAASVDDKALKAKLAKALPKGLSLYPFQEAGVAFVEAAGGKALIGDDLGLGKTIQVLAYLAIHPELHPALVIVPAIVAPNWVLEAEKWIPSAKTHRVKNGKDPIPKDAEIVVITYDLAHRRIEDLIGLKPKALVCDECFPYETRIATDRGDLMIGEVVENNLTVNVLSFNKELQCVEYKSITRWIRKTTRTQLVRVVHESGAFVCTEDHRVWTEGGYVKAKNLSNKNLRVVRNRIPNPSKGERHSPILYKKLCGEIHKFNSRSEGETKAAETDSPNENLRMVRRTLSSCCKVFPEKVLWNQLLCETYQFRSENKARKIETNETVFQRSWASPPGEEESFSRSSYEATKQGSGISGQSSGRTSQALSRGSTVPYSSRWKWNGSHNPAMDFVGGIGRRILPRAHSQDQIGVGSVGGIQTANSLQDRYSPPRKQNCNRGGWPFPSHKNSATTGSKEGVLFGSSRVVRVEILEQQNSRKSENYSGRNTVYDLEVEGNHNYFANDVLVSNCHYVRNYRTKRAQAVLSICKTVNPASVLCLSGTPLVNRPVEFYTTLNLLRPDSFRSWKWFTARYCGGHQGHWGYVCDGATNLGELNSRLKDLMVRRLKSDVLTELPAKTRIDTPVELNNKEIAAYNRAVREAYKANDNHLSAITAARRAVGKAKVRSAVAWIEEHYSQSQPVLVFAHHEDVRQGLVAGAKKAGCRVGHISGKVSQDDRQKAVDEFQAGNLDVMIISTQAGGVGITLTAASNVIFAELQFTPSEMQQAADRAHRIGQTNAVTIRYLLADVEIDRDMNELLTEKTKVISAALDGTDTTPTETDIRKELVRRWASRKG